MNCKNICKGGIEKRKSLETDAYKDFKFVDIECVWRFPFEVKGQMMAQSYN